MYINADEISRDLIVYILKHVKMDMVTEGLLDVRQLHLETRSYLGTLHTELLFELGAYFTVFDYERCVINVLRASKSLEGIINTSDKLWAVEIKNTLVANFKGRDNRLNKKIDTWIGDYSIDVNLGYNK